MNAVGASRRPWLAQDDARQHLQWVGSVM